MSILYRILPLLFVLVLAWLVVLVVVFVAVWGTLCEAAPAPVRTLSTAAASSSLPPVVGTWRALWCGSGCTFTLTADGGYQQQFDASGQRFTGTYWYDSRSCILTVTERPEGYAQDSQPYIWRVRLLPGPNGSVVGKPLPDDFGRAEISAIWRERIATPVVLLPPA